MRSWSGHDPGRRLTIFHVEVDDLEMMAKRRAARELAEERFRQQCELLAPKRVNRFSWMFRRRRK